MSLFLSTLSLRRATLLLRRFPNMSLFLSTLSLRRATMGGKRQMNIRTFLSTLSLRRATKRHSTRYISSHHFYPRSPCGERHTWQKVNPKPKIFLSTLSLRRATHTSGIVVPPKADISIHALLAESDRLRAVQNTKIDISIHALLAESDE